MDEAAKGEGLVSKMTHMFGRGVFLSELIEHRRIRQKTYFRTNGSVAWREENVTPIRGYR